MNDKLFHLIGAVVAVWMSVNASTANAQTTAPGPFYPVPTLSQKLQCDTRATCPRFIVLSDWSQTAVLDLETGLVWERSPSTVGSFSWSGAQDHCNTLSTGDRMGWRLPTVQELTRLMDPHAPFGGLALPPGNPFTSPPFLVWSATISFESKFGAPDATWVVNLRGGGPSVKAAIQGAGAGAWCVRGGQGVSLQ